MPTNCTPLPLYFVASDFRVGDSVWQGPQPAYQKFTTSTWPV
jgi:hypothetical protein